MRARQSASRSPSEQELACFWLSHSANRCRECRVLCPHRARTHVPAQTMVSPSEVVAPCLIRATFSGDSHIPGADHNAHPVTSTGREDFHHEGKERNEKPERVGDGRGPANPTRGRGWRGGGHWRCRRRCCGRTARRACRSRHGRNRRALAGAALDSEGARRAARTTELDAEIGVSGGNLGAPSLQHSPGRDGG